MKPNDGLNVRSPFLTRLLRDQRGQDMIEYALLAASVAVLVAGTLPAHFLPSYMQIWTRVLNVMHVLTGV